MKQNDDDSSSTIARDIESLSIEMMNTIVDRNKSYQDDILLCSVSLHMLMTSMMLLDDEHCQCVAERCRSHVQHHHLRSS